MSTILYVLLAIVLLGILIAVHEFGHFITARLTGIPVREFAIGMGPKLWSRTSKKTGIQYSLRAVPMGGYCAFIGEDDVQQISKDDPRCWAKQKLWKRFLTVLMGPGMNFILAFVVLFFYMLIGPKTIPTVQPVIRSTVADGPAEQAGILPGDSILSIDGTPMQVKTFLSFEVSAPLDAAVTGWKEGDPPLQVKVLRYITAGSVEAGAESVEAAAEAAAESVEASAEAAAAESVEAAAVESTEGSAEAVGESVEFIASVTPRYYPDAKRYMIGITHVPGAVEMETRALSVGESLSYAWRSFRYYSTAIFDAVIGLFRGQNLDQVSGPVGAVKAISENVREYGFDAFIELLALISVNLGIMNLLPIPGLDGSRLIFMIIEGIRGKPVPPEKEAMVHLVGMGLLFALMIFLTFRDVLGLFRR